MYRLKLVLKHCVISSLFLVEFELKINSIYKILLVIMDYFLTFRNFLEFIVFFFSRNQQRIHLIYCKWIIASMLYSIFCCTQSILVKSELHVKPSYEF